MADYSLEVWVPLGGGPITPLPGATSISFTGSPSEGDTISFSLDGHSQGAEHIKELKNDVVLYREGKKIFRGRISSVNHNADAIGHKIDVTCVDYKSLLKRRHVYAATANGTGDIEQKAWDLVAYTQNAGGADWNLGITRSNDGGLGVGATVTWEPLSNIKDNIDLLAKTNSAQDAQDYFEWSIDPELVFTCHRPIRGRVDPQFICDYGGSVLSFGTSFDPNNYANHFYVQGAGSARTQFNTSDVGLWPGAVFEQVVQDSNYTTVDETDGAGFWLATFNGQLDKMRTYDLEISANRWNGPTDLWVGDYVHLDLNSGSLKIQESSYRVLTLHLQIDEAGLERLAVEVGYAPYQRYRDLYRMSNFMLEQRRSLLRQRATWYDTTYRALWSDVLLNTNRYGANSTRAKAALERFNAFKAQGYAFKTSDAYRGISRGRTT